MNTMKKLSVIALSMAMLVSGCTKQNNQADDNNQQSNIQEEQEEIKPEEIKPEEIKPEEIKPEEPIETRPYEVIADGIDYMSVDGITMEEGTSIVFIGKDSTSSFWNTVKKGAVQAVTDLNSSLGYEGKKKIKLTYDAPKKENAIDQINILDVVLDKNPDALCIGFVDISSCTTQMELAHDNGVSLVAVDSNTKEQVTETVCQTDNYQAGREAGRRLFDTLPDGARIAIVDHSSKTQTGIERRQGIIDELEENYAESRIIIADIIYTKEAEMTDAEAIADLFVRNSDLSGIACTNMTTTEALLDYLGTQTDETLQIVGFDTSEKICTAITNGTMIGTIAQNPYAMGYASVAAVSRSVASMENAESISVDYYWVDGSNLQDKDISYIINQ